MHVGMGVIFQGEGEGRTDRNVYRNELRFADLAEPLGFESLWGVEHHFTDYTMCPDVLQYLTYFAGRTQHIQLGSMVVVLPWHDPLRVAEQVVMLDHMSNGRFIFGIGRGLGRVEFEGFRGRTYAAAVSPESSEIMARLGIGLLIIPQKPWDMVADELNAYRRIFRDVNGTDAPPPIVGAWIYCDENAERAAEYGRRYVAAYWHSVVR